MRFTSVIIISTDFQTQTTAINLYGSLLVARLTALIDIIWCHCPHKMHHIRYFPNLMPCFFLNSFEHNSYSLCLGKACTPLLLFSTVRLITVPAQLINYELIHYCSLCILVLFRNESEVKYRLKKSFKKILGHFTLDSSNIF